HRGTRRPDRDVRLPPGGHDALCRPCHRAAARPASRRGAARSVDEGNRMTEPLPMDPALPEESGKRAGRGLIARAVHAATAREAQLRYLSQSVRLEAAVNPHLIRLAGAL